MCHILLERAVGYALRAVAGARSGAAPEFLCQPTPCRGWDLRMLLTHANESLAALQEGLTAGSVALIGPAPAPGLAPSSGQAADPAAAFSDRVTRLLRVSRVSADAPDRLIAVADRPITLGILRAVAALEIAVHGWDVSQACGQRLPIPPALATDLLELSAPLVPRAGRHPMFAPPVPVAPAASPSDRLIAFLGRHPPALSALPGARSRRRI